MLLNFYTEKPQKIQIKFSIFFLEHNYSFRLGNLGFTLENNSKEILVVTLTQTVAIVKPNYADKTFKTCFKVEGVIVEGFSGEDHLIPVISSEHLSDSPAYFLKVEVEKMPPTSKTRYKLGINMDSVECIYNKVSHITTVCIPDSYYWSYFGNSQKHLCTKIKKTSTKISWEYERDLRQG